MTPELLGDAALLASEVIKGVVEELLGAIMIVLRKESKEGKSSDHYGGYEGLLIKGRTSFFHWGFLGLSLGALRRPYSTMHHFGEGPKEEAKSKKI